MVSSICVLVRKAPYGNEATFAALKLGLATTASGLQTAIILLEDGVLAALKNQNPEKIGMPSILDAINDLLSLDVKIYCVEEHLGVRDIQKEDLTDDMTLIHESELTNIILSCDTVTAF